MTEPCERYARLAEARADALDRQYAANCHLMGNRPPPTEGQRDQAAFAARQLRLLAEDCRNGFADEEGIGQ